MTSPLQELDDVLQWWTDENHFSPDLARLRKEIARIARNPRRRNAVENSAIDLLSTSEEQASDQTNGGRSSRLAGFGRVYSTLESPLRRLLWNYAIADAVALRYQRPQAVALRKIAAYVGLAGTGVWTFTHADHLLPGAPVIAAGLNAAALGGASLIVLFTAFSFRYRLRFRQLRHRYLMARSLAEALRIDFFQRLAGTGFHTLEVFGAHHETSKVPSLTFKALESAIASTGEKPRQIPVENPRPDPLRIQWTEDYWVEAQHRYFGKPKVDGSIAGAAGREAEAARSSERWLRGCFILTSCVVVGSLLLMLAPSLVEIPAVKSYLKIDAAQVSEWIRLPRLASELITAWLGIAVACLHQNSAIHAVIAQKFRRAALVLSEARHHLSAPGLTPAYRLATLRYVAYQAIAETADWGIHQREQPMHVAFQ